MPRNFFGTLEQKMLLLALKTDFAAAKAKHQAGNFLQSVVYPEFFKQFGSPSPTDSDIDKVHEAITNEAERIREAAHQVKKSLKDKIKAFLYREVAKGASTSVSAGPAEGSRARARRIGRARQVDRPRHRALHNVWADLYMDEEVTAQMDADWAAVSKLESDIGRVTHRQQFLKAQYDASSPEVQENVASFRHACFLVGKIPWPAAKHSSR